MSSAVPNSIIEITRAELDAIIDAAAERGAAKALKNLGLDDEKAPHDIRDIRQLITAWRDMKSEAMKTAAKMVTTAILTAIIIGLGVQFGVAKFFGSP
ncbi:hypothetical protein EVC24_079 [Rhizobium phage RHph_I4]|nr:hypothetical protein EVC24_079 [Rhizobium phage RHph_I4]